MRLAIPELKKKVYIEIVSFHFAASTMSSGLGQLATYFSE